MGIQYSKMGISHHSFNSSCMGIFVYLLFVDVYTHAHASTRMAPIFSACTKRSCYLKANFSSPQRAMTCSTAEGSDPCCSRWHCQANNQVQPAPLLRCTSTLRRSSLTAYAGARAFCHCCLKSGAASAPAEVLFHTEAFEPHSACRGWCSVTLASVHHTPLLR